MQTHSIMTRAFDVLCDRIEDLRKFPVITNQRDNIEDQIIVNLIAAHREGDEAAGHQLINHAGILIERMITLGLDESDDFFLADIAIDEAIVAERVHFRRQFG